MRLSDVILVVRALRLRPKWSGSALGGATCEDSAQSRRSIVERQRLDKWLWFARVVRTRTLAGRLVGDGHVRVNAQRIETPAKPVRPGDVLTIALERRVRVLRI